MGGEIPRLDWRPLMSAIVGLISMATLDENWIEVVFVPVDCSDSGYATDVDGLVREIRKGAVLQ
jgi:hypothetical protein